MAVSPFMAQGIKLLSFSRPPSSSSPSSSSPRLLQRNFRPTSVKASIAPEECNKEDFAPNKEVEKVSMEWVAEDKTKVVGTYPPVSREQKLSWTGYIEKDTAGQTNIYPVEPTVYVAESAISSGAAGSSADGSESVCDAPHLLAKKSSTAGSKTASSSLATTKKQWEDANVEAAYLSRSAHLVQWYPGHIAKTERELKEQLKLVDVVIQIRDARIPIATCHPEIDSWIGEKSKVLVLNRGDMISTADKNAWANYFSRQGVSTLFTDARHGSGSMKLARTIKATAKDVNEKRRAKGLLPRAVRAAVVGYPNVGKSSLINRLLKRKICQAAPKPGVTRELKWARIGEDLDLMDAPGVLPMRLDDQSAATRLAICNDIGESSYAIAGVACVLVELLKRLPTAGPQVLHKRYKIKAENIAGELFLEELAQRLFAGDINKASHRVLKDYREGKFGWIALERPPLTSMHSI